MELEAAKMIGAGLAAIALAGAGVGIGIIFGNYLSGAMRNPSAAQKQFPNLLLGLGSAISDIWEKIGLDRSIGSKSLIPMMINSCENILKLGIPNSMAGPYVRGDVQTIKMHLEALKKNHSELLPLYVELAKTSIKYSNEKVGPEQTQAEEVLKLLELYS